MEPQGKATDEEMEKFEKAKNMAAQQAKDTAPDQRKAVGLEGNNSAADIIIRGTRDDKGDAFKKQTFLALQSLTNDKLKLDKDGRISIVKQGSGDKTHGTELIRNLVNGKTAGGKDFDVVLSNSTSNSEQNLNKNAYTNPFSSENASNGEGTGSIINISHELKSSLPMQDGSKEKVPYNIAVAHELIHADHNRQGNRSIQVIEGIPQIKNTEELRTIKRENIIRREQGQSQRYDGNL